MKMAKASQADLEMAMDLANVLEDIDRGYFPAKFSDPENEGIEWLRTDDTEQYARLVDGLQTLLDMGSISRVVWGMAVVCDPANECIDPDASTIDHHPKRQQMEEALLWALCHHQGSRSNIGRPIRRLLGIGQHDQLTAEQLKQAKKFGGVA